MRSSTCAPGAASVVLVRAGERVRPHEGSRGQGVRIHDTARKRGGCRVEYMAVSRARRKLCRCSRRGPLGYERTGRITGEKKTQESEASEGKRGRGRVGWGSTVEGATSNVVTPTDMLFLMYEKT